MSLSAFHPAVARWFGGQFDAPSPAQALAWPAIRSGRPTLIAAPTGSGKTLAAFLAASDALVRAGLEAPLPDETRVLYVSPLKALSNDVHKNLELPLNGIRDALLESGVHDVPIRAAVRSGDTPPGEREAMKRRPPHILVTTPESLYLLLTSSSGRRMLATVESVIVDEIHALAGNKRGAHLTLSLERLAALTPQPPVRIGLSATQKPIEDMARYLTGGDGDCLIVDTGHVRARDLALELPGSPLEAVMANEVWTEIYDRLTALIEDHRTTLIFVNTRRLAERAAAALSERLGEAAVTAHHGSLAREHRLDAEQRLKRGELRALVATASLELGIDIGDVDLVCQLGSPHAIATLLQRVGRSGHRLGALPKGRLFPLSRDDLVECAALLRAVARDELDRIPVPAHPLDVLAQQIVAEVAARDWEEDALYRACVRAWPYRDLARADFDAVVRMLAEGFHTRRGRRGAYLHRDAVHGMLRARRGARLVALTNGGAIPDQFDYQVILQPEGLFIGTVNEDFAFESLSGDVFQLGNTAYRMLKIEQGRVFVEDAHGQPPNIPFWFGEAPGRSDELSQAVSALRADFDALLAQGTDAALREAAGPLGLPPAAAEQLVAYLAAGRAALGLLPTQSQVVFERFFDELGDQHLVIHSPYGSRLNRAWGLALRKRFCRRFNFELQAAAGEDSIVLSLGPTHSFPLDEPARYLKAATAEDVLVQALLTAPMFGTRWRWVANTALAVPRNHAGRRRPPQFQRGDAEDLIAVVFPDQLACAENLAGERAVPEHPLVAQTLYDCLHELMDIDGLRRLLADIEAGTVEVVPRETTTPSPLALEILNARPYAFLDDAPAEERRVLAVQQRRHLDPAEAAEIGQLDPAATARVRAEAWPSIRDADELHDALLILGALAEGECEPAWRPHLDALIRARRATVLAAPAGPLWIAAERLHGWRRVLPEAEPNPPIEPAGDERFADSDEALRELVRSRLEGLGPVTAAGLAAPLSLPQPGVEAALAALEAEGFVLRGRFDPGLAGEQWCERGLLARIHRDTLNRLRREIEPVSPADFMRFLFHWQGLDEPGTGVAALQRSLAQLEGLNLPAASWEAEVLPARIQPYWPGELDELCRSGHLAWLRLQPPAGADRAGRRRKPAVKTTPLALLSRAGLAAWQAGAAWPEDRLAGLSSPARAVHAQLAAAGASFYEDLLADCGLLRSQLEEALGELVAAGLATADGFQGLRALIAPRRGQRRHTRRAEAVAPLAAAGRWSLLRTRPPAERDAQAHAEHIARTLLRRYGVVFRKLLEREQGLPDWRTLLYVFRRLEARGELRGGRFVEGFAGEQYALPEAVAALREVRRRPAGAEYVVLAAADPLNLTGIVTPGERVPPLSGHRLLYRDGVPAAASAGQDLKLLAAATPDEAAALRHRLLRRPHPAAYHPPPQRPV
ncbi:DEAD/DEAH box helicase [Acidihalobacter prosperus]|uniref:Lhr-like helicase n=1 Tax=Acidihalobacter prosperus TaxID=160660 RepID=A0A1A6C7M0_9GAMM|nr:DEAD/DEAH box helicase [Acidihalobacter prosperus]OBS10557.1 Lhr-like helicase [Acidihalobacter prosperus]